MLGDPQSPLGRKDIPTMRAGDASDQRDLRGGLRASGTHKCLPRDRRKSCRTPPAAAAYSKVVCHLICHLSTPRGAASMNLIEPPYRRRSADWGKSGLQRHDGRLQPDQSRRESAVQCPDSRRFGLQRIKFRDKIRRRAESYSHDRAILFTLRGWINRLLLPRAPNVRFWRSMAVRRASNSRCSHLPMQTARHCGGR